MGFTLKADPGLGLSNANPIKLNPTKPEDWDTITVPVLPKPYHEYPDTNPPSTDQDTRSSSSSGLKLWKRLSHSDSDGPKWTTKEISRDVYLRHYAKDSEGKYVGTERPADDCLLRRGSDVERYRGGRGPVSGEESEAGEKK